MFSGADGEQEAGGEKGVDQLRRTVHGREIGGDDRPIQRLLAVVQDPDPLLARLTRTADRPEGGDDVPAGAAERGREILPRERKPVLLGQHEPALEVSLEGVHQDAVHVEEHRALHGGSP